MRYFYYLHVYQVVSSINTSAPVTEIPDRNNDQLWPNDHKTTACDLWSELYALLVVAEGFRLQQR